MAKAAYKCPLSTKCPFHSFDPKTEVPHLEWHKNRRTPPLLKLRILPGQTYTSNHILIKNSFRHPIYITVKENEKEVLKTGGVSMHSEWRDL